MEHKPKPPCLVCFKLIEDVEQDLFEKRHLTGALSKIEEFFLSIGWIDPERIPPRDPQLLDDAEADAAVERYQEAAYANRSRYTELVDCKIPDTLKISPERRRELTVFAESIHANSIVTCSVYIEHVLLFILAHTRGDQFNACVKLIFYGPMKERYRNFMAYTESRVSGMSGPGAMNNFRSFMSLSHALIMKKIDIPILEQEREMPLIHIIFFLTRMYITIRDLLQKIDDERGSGGIDIQVVSDWFDKCNQLKKRFEKNIIAEMRHVVEKNEHLKTRRRMLNSALQHLQLQDTAIVSEIQRLEEEITATKTTYDNLDEKLKELGRETKPLIDIIRDLDRRMALKSQPSTPGGGSKSKKNKKSFSKSKKYKKSSRSKKYKKNVY